MSTAMSSIIRINGNYLEGGGQILRAALALSCITKKPFEIYDIRKGRDKPGLKSQHLYCIKALEKLYNAKTEGAEIGSMHLKFWPGEIRGGTLSLDLETAGSITLVLQSLILPSIFAKEQTRLKIRGGTDVAWSIPIDYFNHVFIPCIVKYADITLDILSRGYYPKGGGFVDIKLNSKVLVFENNELESIVAPPLKLTSQGKLTRIYGISHASESLKKQEVAERQAKIAKRVLANFGANLECPIKIDIQYWQTLSPGSGIALFALFDSGCILAGDALGEKGKRSEDVGTEAAEKLVYEIKSGATVDVHLADNLVPFLALFGGEIKTSNLSSHTMTNLYTTQLFLGERLKYNSKEATIFSI
ncbi:MAG: RNA 3'-terminal phosphate cyclase [Candidatus Woesearchaeota archaeon]